MSENANTRRAEQFAAYIREAARRAGYDIDSPRGGGKTAIARATGMSQSSVGRIIAGTSMPDPVYLQPLARTLRVPIEEMLVLSGLVSRESLTEAREAPAQRPLSPRDAANDLGIRDPSMVDAFETMVRALLTQQNIRSEDDRESRGDAA
ncbi:helix-turn-helix domain-containing protein [Streptomyces sp. NPDC058045]|uniref:helix-turn-helix domain-containing protein n=1 Tax=Streptomyces sp. NPDC058045 TaxID=3346311 RepID=UPI0036E21BB6